MGKLLAFNFITLNGFYKGPNEDIGWHRHGSEEGEYAAESSKPASTLLFGRVTYQMMASFWPTPAGMAMNPAVAENMNNTEKIVFSRTMTTADWNNTRLIKDDLVGEVKKLKAVPGKDMTILGSGSLITQLADNGLIDEYQIMLDPVVLGDGTPLFKGLLMNHKVDLKLIDTKVFKSGVVLLRYEPM